MQEASLNTCIAAIIEYNKQLFHPSCLLMECKAAHSTHYGLVGEENVHGGLKKYVPYNCNCNCNWRICSALPTISPMAHYTVKLSCLRRSMY